MYSIVAGSFALKHSFILLAAKYISESFIGFSTPTFSTALAVLCLQEISA